MESKSGPRGHDATSLTKTPGRFAIYQAILTLGKLFTLTQGRRHNFKSVGTNITVSEASRTFFWGLYPPHMPFWGYNSYKERHTESLLDSVATVSYWSCSCINRPINVFYYLQIIGRNNV